MDELTGNTVLVTGGSGFIGQALCAELVRVGAVVHGVSRSRRASESGVRWCQADLAATEQVREMMFTLKPAIVYHLASEVTGNRAMEAVLPTLNANLFSTVNLLLAAAETGCRRIVLAGSLEEPAGDIAAAVAQSPYAAAKWGSSIYAGMFHALYGTPAVTARLFMIYGPGQRDLRKLIPHVILSLLKGEVPKLSSGTRPVDWVYVDDVVRGLMALGVAPGLEGGTYDLGSGELVTVREVAELICRLHGGGVVPAFGGIADRPLERVRRADVERTLNSLDWTPQISIEDGLQRTLQWYAEQLHRGELSLAPI